MAPTRWDSSGYRARARPVAGTPSPEGGEHPGDEQPREDLDGAGGEAVAHRRRGARDQPTRRWVIGTHAPATAEDVRRFFTSWTETANARDWESFGTLMHRDVVIHDPMGTDPARGRAEAVARTHQMYEPFPDGATDVVGEPFTSVGGSELAYRWRFTGTHLAAISPQGFAATGQRVVLDGMSVVRFEDQKVIEVTLTFDTTDLARQVLAAPAAGSPLERVVVVSQRLRTWVRRRRAR